jgi:hypothetical protein
MLDLVWEDTIDRARVEGPALAIAFIEPSSCGHPDLSAGAHILLAVSELGSETLWVRIHTGSAGWAWERRSDASDKGMYS